MSIKLIGIDLDGTLFYQRDTASPESIRTLERCAQEGIHVCICTGRSFAQVAGALACGATFDKLCVLTNGASIMNWKTNEFVLERRIDPNVADPMLRALYKDCTLVPGRRFFISGMYRTHMLEGYVNPGLLANGSSHAVVHKTLDDLIEACKSDIQRIDYSVSFSDGQRVLDFLTPIVELDITSGDPNRLELVPKGINKGDGLSRLANYYGIPRESVMAVGDGINDDSMIQWAGLGVAMGNAPDCLKAVADAVTDTVTNNGLAKAIEKYAFNR